MSFPAFNTEVGKARPFRKMTLDVGGVETANAPAAVYERQMTSSGQERLLISVPADRPELFRRLTDCLPGPFYLLYIHHTPRSGGEPGRYQSPLLEREALTEFLVRFQDYLAGDARHDVWVYSTEDARTLIWDRHDQLYAEGDRLDDLEAVLATLGFKQAPVARIGTHAHYYRVEFDDDAQAVLDWWDWRLTPLRPEDEQ